MLLGGKLKQSRRENFNDKRLRDRRYKQLKGKCAYLKRKCDRRSNFSVHYIKVNK